MVENVTQQPFETDAQPTQIPITGANATTEATQGQPAGGKAGGQGAASQKPGGQNGNFGDNQQGGKPGGGQQNGTWWGGGAPTWTGDQGNIWGDNTAGVAGSNPMLDFANSQIWNMGDNNRYTMNSENAINQSIMAGLPQMLGADATYSGLADSGRTTMESRANDAYSLARVNAARRISGDTIANDPAVAAANETFQQAMMPMIQNQAALSGLGRSTAMTNALSAQQAQTMLPLIQEAMAREERGIGQEVQTGLQAGQGYAGIGRDMSGRMLGGAGGMMNLANMQGQRQANAAGMFTGLQGQQHGQMMDQIGAAMGSGQYGRNMTQEGLDAAYNEFLRKSGMFEDAVQGPLGGIGGVIGGITEGKK